MGAAGRVGPPPAADHATATVDPADAWAGGVMGSGTLAYPLLRQLATEWERLYPSAVCSGIAPDQAHVKRGGYHVSRRQNPPRNYSIVRREDIAGNGPDDASAAIDMSMNRRDMILCSGRLRKVWANRNDPRRKYINAINGWLGEGSPRRWDMVAQTDARASEDHSWHVHLDVRRKYVKVQAMVHAIVSALRGESVDGYLRSLGLPPAPKPGAARPAAPPYPGRQLERGDGTAKKPDPAVKAWQKQMKAGRGWKLTDDGVFGAGTERAVIKFQKTCKLKQDGKIGPKTWPLAWTKPLGS